MNKEISQMSCPIVEMFPSVRHSPVTHVDILQFEERQSIKLPAIYKSFLLQSNGGSPIVGLFYISEEQGVSVMYAFNGIGEMDDNLDDKIRVYDERLPIGFIPIASDGAGNVICMGTMNPYMEHIFFWDHEEEPDDPDDMSNMYLLATDFVTFLNNLYEEPEDDDER